MRYCFFDIFCVNDFLYHVFVLPTKKKRIIQEKQHNNTTDDE